MAKNTNTAIAKLSYQDIKQIDLFFNANDGYEIIRRLIEQCQANAENSDTRAAKFQWIELRAKLNQVAEQAGYMLELGNEEAKKFKTKQS